MKRTRARFLCLVALFSMIAGCGLHDYEQRMDEQQKRVAIFDEESRLLSSTAIDLPKADTKDGKKVEYWPFDVFLRLPFGYSTQPIVPGYMFNSQPPQLFRYNGSTGYTVFLAAGLIAEEKKAAKDKGKAANEQDKPKLPEWPIDTFRNHVRGALMDYYRKEYKANPTFPLFERKSFREYAVKPLPERGFNLPQVKYEAIAFNENQPGTQFQAYFHQSDTRQFAIVVQIPIAAQADPTVRAGIDWSLKTLELGNGAISRRNALLARRNF